jgi:putative hemolysin
MQSDTNPGILSFSGIWDQRLRSFLEPVEPAVDRIFGLEALRQAFLDARRASRHGDTVEELLRSLDIAWRADPEELARIPAAGPALVVANHPFGLVEGAILSTVLSAIRPDVRILTNSLLAGVDELQRRCIFVNPFGASRAVPANARALREANHWLEVGGMLAVFPAGEVAHFDWRNGTLADPPWNPAVTWIAQRSGACAVPVFFEGANGLGFQLAGAIHPGLRTASLPREFLNKRGKTIRMRIGRPVPAGVLRGFVTPREAVDYLRCRTYLLGFGTKVSTGVPRLVRDLVRVRPAAPLAVLDSTERLAEEIGGLDPGRKLLETAEFAVYAAGRDEFPGVVQEIGRLREAAFRQVGEGTGRARDLDRFDGDYTHLVLWSRQANEVAGAYRLGATGDILPRRGVRGLYTSTLFRFRGDLFDRLGPALELGRSFIRPEYQKQFAPLLLLWKGIAAYVARRPECAVLFGAVSISNEYHAVSRHLIVRFLEAHRAAELSDMVKPRRPYRFARLLRHTGQLPPVPADADRLSELIADLERDGKGIPILLRQYLKTGGKLLAFHVDHAFSDVLDALIMVDLRAAPAPVLDRYFGKSAAARFLAWHSGRHPASEGGIQ